MDDLNKVLVDLVVENQKEWFKLKKKKAREDIVEEMFSSSIRPPKEEKRAEYSDTFKITVPYNIEKKCKEDYVEFSSSETKESLKWEDVFEQKGFQAVCIFRITGAWVSQSLKKFGYFIKLAHMQVTPSARRALTIQTYDSDTDESDDGNDDLDDLDGKVDEESEVEDVDDIDDEE